METPPDLKLGFVVGLGVALAGRWANSWVGVLAIVAGACFMLYAKRQPSSKADAHSHTTLSLQR